MSRTTNIQTSETYFRISDGRNAARGNWIGWLPLVVLPVATCAFRERLVPWKFMWLLAAAIFWGCKFETWYRARVNGANATLTRNLGYLFLWPGMDAAAFLGSSAPPKPGAYSWVVAASRTLAGAACIWLAVPLALQIHPLLGGWIGMAGMTLVLHFGTFHLLALAWQAAGINARPIMQSPFKAQSLSEFWGRRWNLGFRQLTYGLVFDPLRRRLGAAPAILAAFLASGLIHDLVISYPARGGYGLPTVYFLLQGTGVLAEKSLLGSGLGIQRGIRGWLFVFIFVAGPAFFLFHPPFVTRVILPFLAAIGAAR
jgi:hypothetical protein